MLADFPPKLSVNGFFSIGLLLDRTIKCRIYQLVSCTSYLCTGGSIILYVSSIIQDFSFSIDAEFILISQKHHKNSRNLKCQSWMTKYMTLSCCYITKWKSIKIVYGDSHDVLFILIVVNMSNFNAKTRKNWPIKKQISSDFITQANLIAVCYFWNEIGEVCNKMNA